MCVCTTAVRMTGGKVVCVCVCARATTACQNGNGWQVLGVCQCAAAVCQNDWW